MYDLSPVVPDAEVEPGTNLLIAGPSQTGKRRLGLRLLAAGARNGEGAVVVTTKTSSRRILEEYDDISGADATAPIGVVDCVTQQQRSGPGDDDRVRYAAAPADMTGIGIELSGLLEEFYGERGLRRNRIMLYSVSTLLMYSNLRTVFRFLHVLTGRIESVDALGVFVVDSTAHEGQEMNTIRQLFDVVMEVQEADDGGDPTIRMRGL